LKNGISIETGILYDKKNYYTKGKYFDKKSLGYYFQNVEIINADGNCSMWEIPLNIQYDFASAKKYNWFVTAGLSSYLMHNEYYNFTYKKDGEINSYAKKLSQHIKELVFHCKPWWRLKHTNKQ